MASAVLVTCRRRRTVAVFVESTATAGRCAKADPASILSRITQMSGRIVIPKSNSAKPRIPLALPVPARPLDGERHRDKILRHLVAKLGRWEEPQCRAV